MRYSGFFNITGKLGFIGMDVKTQQNANILQKTKAWGVHLFTASGAVWGILAVVAIQEHNWKAAIFWMVMAIFVDGFDGWLARWAKVKTFVPGVDGALLDNILDYFNYVIVPGLFLYEAGLLPEKLALSGIVLIAIVSSFQFSQTDAKTEDHYFTGFPSYWNVVAIYLLVLELNVWVNLVIVLVLGILVFVPIKYVYPSRTMRLQQVTLILTFLWAGIGLIGLYQYPNVDPWIVWISFGYIGYYVAISLIPKKRITGSG